MKLYIVAPENFASGGPELLHQLAFEMRDRGIETYMYYFPNGNNAVHENYKQYKINTSKEIDDNKENLLLIPEIYTHILQDYKNIKKIVWWLSVDSYFLNAKSYFKRYFNEILLKNFNHQNYFFFDKELLNLNIVHLYQSEYARIFLLSKGVKKMHSLSDFLHESFIRSENNYNFNLKQKIVAYNPAKGVNFTKKIMASAPEIKFIPIVNMTRSEVSATLALSMVYIDFGNHPGKDRIPREAAILGNCIITNKRGSANNNVDVLIPEKYKFSEKNSEINKIIYVIKKSLEYYSISTKDFEDYRKNIRNEEFIFKKEVDEIINILS